MPMALFATLFGAVAAAGMYAFKKQTQQGLEERDDELVIERLDSIALRDAIVAPDQRIFVAPSNVGGRQQAD